MNSPPVGPLPMSGLPSARAICTLGADSDLASATLSDPLLRGVLISALAVTALAVMLLFAIGLLRLRLMRRERRTITILNRWRPLLALAAAGDFSGALPIDETEGELLLPLWNQLRESVRGESAASLDAFAQRVGLDRTARALLSSGNARARLLAMNTLGHLGAIESAVKLEHHCHDDDTIVSLAAVRALLRIDSAAALPLLVPLMLNRPDWSIARLLPMPSPPHERALQNVVRGESLSPAACPQAAGPVASCR